MNKAERTMKIDMLRRELAMLENRKPACGTCKNFDQLGSCELAPEQFVPTEVISTGCDEWQDDGIPF